MFFRSIFDFSPKKLFGGTGGIRTRIQKRALRLSFPEEPSAVPLSTLFISVPFVAFPLHFPFFSKKLFGGTGGIRTRIQKCALRLSFPEEPSAVPLSTPFISVSSVAFPLHFSFFSKKPLGGTGAIRTRIQKCALRLSFPEKPSAVPLSSPFISVPFVAFPLYLSSPIRLLVWPLCIYRL